MSNEEEENIIRYIDGNEKENKEKITNINISININNKNI